MKMKHKMEFQLNFVICVVTVSKLLCLCDALTYSIYEGGHANKFIVNVAEDSKLSEQMTVEQFSTLRFTLTDEEDMYSSYFNISEQSGDLYTVGVLDREQFCAFKTECNVDLEIYAQSVVYPVFRIIEVTLLVIDTNDNEPVFSEPMEHISIPESLQVDKSVTIEGALDPDSPKYSVKNYSISTPDVPFSAQLLRKLDGNSVVQIIVEDTLDRETRDNYQIEVIALDCGSPPKTGSVLVNISITDVNDNPPVFTHGIYNATVKEDLAVNSTILQVSASDLDLGESRKVSYSLGALQSQEIMDMFTVEQFTGEVKNSRRLAYTPEEPYKIYIEATDSGPQPHTTQAIIYVHVLDVNNNAPKIKLNLLNPSNFAKVSEKANPGAVVAIVQVSDDDVGWNGITNCSIRSNMFKLQLMGANKYQVVVGGELDRETQSLYSVSITCQDVGSPPLFSNKKFNISVQDENDNKPVFSEPVYFHEIFENNKYRDDVLWVSASDLDDGDNSKVKYELQGDAFMDFTIDANSGRIRAGQVFDRETRDSYTFHVLAIDGGKPTALTATATVSLTILDRNDNSPQFNISYYEFKIAENQQQNEFVGQVFAKDDDLGANGFVTYSLAEIYEISLPFKLLPDGTLRTKVGLDRENKSRYDFMIIASDQGAQGRRNSSVDVTVFVTDINDNSPYIDMPEESGHTIQVSYKTPINTPLYLVKAYDDDYGVNAELVYTIQDRNDSHIFDINHSGEVLVSRPMDISDVKSYSLEVVVYDNGQPRNFAKTKLLMNVTPENVTSVAPVQDNMHNQNLLIALSVVIVTIVLAATIMVTICVIRRMDQKRRDFFGADSSSDGSGEVEVVPGLVLDGQKDFNFSRPSNTVHLVPIISHDTLQKEYSFKELEKPGPSSLSDDSAECQIHETSESQEDSSHLHRLASLRLHQALLQTQDKQWTSHGDDCQSPDLFSNKKAEDSHSQMSGDTGTFDSGRGGSVSDGHSNMGVSHDTEDMRILQLQNIVRQSGRRGTPPHLQKDSTQPRNSDYSRPKAVNNQSDQIRRPSRDQNQSGFQTDQSDSCNVNLYPAQSGDSDSECSEPKRIRYSNPPVLPPRTKCGAGIQMGLSSIQSHSNLNHPNTDRCRNSIPNTDRCRSPNQNMERCQSPNSNIERCRSPQSNFDRCRSPNASFDRCRSPNMRAPMDKFEFPNYPYGYQSDKYMRNPMQGRFMDETLDSIATTYDDDDNTTTSGSYTIDNVTEEFPQELNIVKLKDVYV